MICCMKIQRTDFREIIKNLNFVGITNVEIARRTGARKATITQLKTGIVIDPRYSLGHQLILMHGTEMKKFRSMLESKKVANMAKT